ncbi:hypothetical protein KKI21_02585 [Patescibacteria group bacterium]|nr:hypothetical protein [Patescibacteria group bacterium]MCG2696365.1 hypothetical protein [Candidatus Portnoybacteria bacterium]
MKPEEIEGWKKFVSWMKQELEKFKKPEQSLLKRIFKRRAKPCGCVSSVLNPSWASKMHCILFHVCEKHAKEFGIPDGPYWADHFTGTPWEKEFGASVFDLE